MSEPTPLHIVSLTAENVKRLSAVTIRPDGAMVLIGGQNAQGKTSLLDSIEMALGGGKTIPIEPVRRGARKARITVDLGDIVVERTFSPKGTALEVRNAEGVPQKSPQALLDSLCSKVSFDPLAFAREEPKKQDAILKQVLGLDFSALDSKRESLFAERRDLKRDAKALEARLDATTRHIGIPEQEVSVADLTVELERINEERAANQAKRHAVERAGDSWTDWDMKVTADLRRIADLEAQLAEAKDTLEGHEAMRDGAATARQDAEAVAAALVDPDPEPIRQQIADAEGINRRVRENAQHKELEKQLKTIDAQVEELTAGIENVDAEKARQLEAAPFPVPGLGFDETGPTLSGIPLSQASQAERLRVSVAIGAALNPRVRVMLVRDGSLLDERSMQLLAELARETDSQLWIERVGDRDETAVIIEDGMVRESVEEPAAQ
jgi:DNA repair exonuclease SbcCD ATPase subunit